MFSAVSNVLPLHIRQEFPSTATPVDALKPHVQAAVETPRAPSAAERRSDAGSDPSRGRDPSESQAGFSEGQLSQSEQQEVEKLRSRDAEVRRHEQAHAAAGGSHTGAPNFKFKRGPDGRMYAVSGHVSVDTSSISGDPEATLRKMRQIQRAALAPAQPSAQDRKVASQAAAKALRAQKEILAEKSESIQQATGSDEDEAASTVGAEASGSGPNPGNEAQSAVQANRSGAAYQAGSAVSSAPPDTPSIQVLACQTCGNAHAP